MANQPAQEVKILSESSQVTFPTPGQPKIVVAVTYQAGARPPRTVWIDESAMPDMVYAREHPAGPLPPADLVRKGDEVRSAAIKADLDRLAAAPPGRTIRV